MSRLKQRFNSEIKQALQEKFGFSNPMLIPVLKKIVISMGIGEASKDKNSLQDCIKELTQLSGQKPLMLRSKVAIANFKVREGQPLGLKVTLRRKRMYDFFDRFVNIVVPRIRDFRGFSHKCDGRGCYSLGLEDQQIFPEISLDEVKRKQGMNITFVTSASTDKECFELLKLLGMPFKTA
uniref:Large ribosomal subunit protein uL5 n=1 Tax=uncultured Chlamydiae bacterium Rifle_16ft_4_minimus_1822 TaxID=1665093 RepID=A0A0H4T3U3_9BACT|nr:50S ribosomal protein L5, large subunit ribosomal protein L5 [uncultured Chlamydiae bacterium Rifle_16ft_4_minimus_1822]